MFNLKSLLSISIFYVSIPQVGAADQYWVSNAGDFDDPALWFSGAFGGFSGPGSVPGPSDRAVFWNGFGGALVSTLDQNRNIWGIMAGANETTLDLGGFRMQMRNPTAYPDPARGTLVLGEEANHDGGLTLLDGTLESMGEVVVAGATGTNQTLRIGEGAFLDAVVTSGATNHTRDIHLGVNGTGQLVAADGGKLIADDLRVGINAGSVGTFSLNATGANGTRADFLGDAIFGERGTGYGVISNGSTFLTLGRSSIGADFASANSSLVTLQSGGRWFGNSFDIGGFSSGRLSLSDGSLANGSLFTVAGRQMGDIVGHIDLQTGSELNASNSLYVGLVGGTGKLDVLSGSEVNVTQDLQIGVGQSSDGIGLLSGSNSQITVGDDFVVGTYGTGQMTITSGADLQTDRSFVGWRFNDLSETRSDGTVSLSGSGSTWTNDGLFYVGHAGKGSLDISSGGVLTNTGSDFYLGRESTGDGTVTVEDEGSLIDASGRTVILGRLGKGEMNLIGDPDVQGSVTPPSLVAENLTLGYSAGSSGRLEILNGNGNGQKIGDEAIIPNLALTERLTVGRAGDAEMSMHRTFLPVKEVMVGEFGGTDANIVMNKSLMQVEEELVLAKSGSATLTLDNGATIYLTRPDLFTMAVNPASVATLSLLDGEIGPHTGSDFSVPHQPIIGDNGGAFVFMAGKSRIFTDGPIFARGPSSSATVVIPGIVSTVNRAEWLIGEAVEVGGIYSNCIVGDAGEALIDIPGGLLIAQRRSGLRQFVLGNQPGGSGTIRVSDYGSFSSQGIVVVGDGGEGLLQISDGGRGSVDELQVGNGSRGVVSVSRIEDDGSRTLDAFYRLDAGLGAGGEAEMLFDDGRGSTGELCLGIDGGSVDFLVTGPIGTFLSEVKSFGVNGAEKTSGNSIVGESGQAELNVENGGFFEVEGDLTAGRFDTGEAGSPIRSVGSMTVTGVGSELEVAGHAIIGAGGSGNLAIEAGGAGEFETLTLGDGVAGLGELIVNGIGSALDVDGELQIGRLGEGSLVATAGAYVGADSIRFNGGSNALFSGNGTLVETSGNFRVAGSGNNRATVSNGAILSVGQALTLMPGDNFDLLTNGTLKVREVFGNLTNISGIFSPGPSAAPVGVVPISGFYSQASGGTLLMEIGGPLFSKNYDTVVPTLNFFASGELRVVLTNGYSPQLGDSFRLIQADEIVGEFSSILLPTLPGNLDWEIDQSLTEFVINVIELSPLQVWRRTFGLAADGSQDLDDLSGNGVANLFYFAFGMGDPAVRNASTSDAASETLGMPSVYESPTAGRYYFVYTRHRDEESGVNYLEGATTSLGDWEDLRTLTNTEKIMSETIVQSVGSDYEIVELELLSMATRRFHRVEVSTDD